MFQSWFRHGIPLYLLITGLVLGAVVLTTALQLNNIHGESLIISQMQATATFDMASRSVVDDVERAMDPVLALVNTSSGLQHETTGLTTFAAANKQFLASSVQALASRRDIFAVNYGFSDGSFYSVAALRSETARSGYKAPEGTAYAVWSVIPDKKGVKHEWWLFLDVAFKELGAHNAPSAYDPRTRQWYKDAMATPDQLIMTTPYVFTTSKQLGLACAKVLKSGAGVYAVNISLSNFSTLLAGISMSRSSSLFLLDSGMRVIASGMPDVAERLSRGELVHLADIDKDEGHDVYQYLVNRNFAVFGSRMVEMDGKNWFLQFMRIPMGNNSFNLLLMAPTSDYLAFAENLFFNAALFAFFAMLSCMPLAIWLSMRISNPLRTLMRETQRIATSSVAKPEERVVSPIYEVHRLAKAIYSMEETIGTRTEALRSMKEHLEVLVAERTCELSVAIARAEEGSQAKSAFLATMSHEIRTPMNAIIGFTHLFETVNLNARQLDYLAKIRLSAEALLTIINDVLDVSKIEARKLTLEHIPFRLHAVVDSVRGIMELAANKKNLQLQVVVDGDVPETYTGDPTRLHQVLLNLLSNAVKFTQAGAISLHVSLDSEQPLEPAERVPGTKLRLRIQVRDTGIGIASENLVKLFEPFMQADQSVTRKFGGTGLGLVICKQLLELMDGDIYGESVEGVGTTFTCRLLLEWQDNADVEEEKQNTLDSAIEELARFAGLSVLVVEDNLINQEIVLAMLEPAGLNVFCTNNGQECLDYMQENTVDLVLMDMQMPVMDGLQATQCLRKMRNPDDSLRFPAEKLPIIAMTANAMNNDKAACLDAGMNDYVSKPVNPEKLYSRMAHWLGKIHSK